jgi:Ni/Co efflux regulator RcnB
MFVPFRPLSRAFMGFVVGMALLSTFPALSQKPDAANGGPQGRAAADKRPSVPGQPPAARADENATRSQGQEPGGIGFFRDAHREAVTGYFAPRIAAGKCPPGLAKKNNGCLPPGIAKQWAMGQSLPDAVSVHRLPEELRRRLGLPPAGYEYGRVDDDVLLIEIGTRKVVDAIFGLGDKR